jgi:predicted nuclease of predicted toxin-antitoxin system
MKLLADNNLSPKLTKILSEEFPESKHLMATTKKAFLF